MVETGLEHGPLEEQLDSGRPEQQQQQQQVKEQPAAGAEPSHLETSATSEEQQQQQQPQQQQELAAPRPAKLKPAKGERKRRRKKKRPAHKSKMITGYIIYASEIRKDVIKKFPDRDFGYISKLVGIEWKNLPAEAKVEYERRAQEQNAESRAIAATELKRLTEAEERAREQALLTGPPTTANGYFATSLDPSSAHHFRLVHNSFPAEHPHQVHHLQLPNSGASHPQSPLKISMQHQAPLQIIHQHPQTHPQASTTTIQYCNGDPSDPSQPRDAPSPLQRNTIVYRKPATVRLKPRDAPTQTEPIHWISAPPKKPLRFSQAFIDYLSRSFNA